jgi:Sulfotransferase family
MSGADRVRVLYIGGWGRSGSTLVDRVLGQVPGVASLGEVRELWSRGWVENRPCGCGKPFADCPFWTAVGERAFGGWNALDRGEVLALRYSIDRAWNYPALIGRRGPRSFADRLDRYVAILDRLYTAIGEVSGAQVVVDSSKLPTHALLLRRVPSVDLRVVHLIRDARGVAFSWRKQQLSATTGAGQERYLERYNPVAASGRYVLYNALTTVLARTGVPLLRVRYEDFVADPPVWTGRILSHAGLSVGRAQLAFLHDGEADLAPNHTVDGNPMRFSVGPVRIRVDDEWRRRMPRSDRVWVTALTAPSLLRYGYLSKGRP